MCAYRAFHGSLQKLHRFVLVQRKPQLRCEKKDIPTALSWGHLVSFWHVFFLYYNEQESGSTRITRYNHLIQKKPPKAGFRECFRSSERISKRCCRWSQTRRIDYKNRIYALRSLSLLHVFVVCFSLALAGGRLPGNLYIN